MYLSPFLSQRARLHIQSVQVDCHFNVSWILILFLVMWCALLNLFYFLWRLDILILVYLVLEIDLLHSIVLCPTLVDLNPLISAWFYLIFWYLMVKDDIYPPRRPMNTVPSMPSSSISSRRRVYQLSWSNSEYRRRYSIRPKSSEQN